MLLLAVPAFASDEAGDKASDRDDRVKDIVAYLDDLRQFSADFYQYTSEGEISKGKLYISRPGKMRIEYLPPPQLLIIADGNDINYYDYDLPSYSKTDISTTVVDFMLDKEILPGKRYLVDRVVRKGSLIEVDIVRQDNPNYGIRLIFFAEPLKILGWSVNDARGVRTDVRLQNIKKEKNLSLVLFTPVAPPVLPQKSKGLDK